MLTRLGLALVDVEVTNLPGPARVAGARETPLLDKMSLNSGYLGDFNDIYVISPVRRELHGIVLV